MLVATDWRGTARDLVSVQPQGQDVDRLECTRCIGESQSACSDVAHERVGHFGECENRRVPFDRSSIDRRNPLRSLPARLDHRPDEHARVEDSPLTGCHERRGSGLPALERREADERVRRSRQDAE